MLPQEVWNIMSLAHNPRVVMDGLKLYLDTSNIKSYSGTGSTLFDLSGNANDSDLVGSPSFSNSVLVFDAIDDRIVCPADDIILSKDSRFTWEFWLKPTTVDANDRFFICYTRTGANDLIVVYTSTYVRAYLGAATYTINTTNFTANSWHHVVLTFDFILDRFEVYIDNSFIGVNTSFTGTIPDGTYQINLFVDQDSPTGYNQYYVGEVSSVKFYDRVLASEEVSQNYKALKKRYGM